jgi:hypothetical protein
VLGRRHVGRDGLSGARGVDDRLYMARRPAMSPTAGGAKPDSAIGASAAAISGSRVRDMVMAAGF